MNFSFQVLDILACDCRRKCSAGSCTCIDARLKCTDACKLKDCENQYRSCDDSDDSDQDNEPQSEDDDSDDNDDDIVYLN